jgi:hypothetical protein
MLVHVRVWVCWIRILYQGTGIPLIGLTLPHCCACPKPGPGFPTSDVVVFVFSWDKRWLFCLLILVEFIMCNSLILCTSLSMGLYLHIPRFHVFLCLLWTIECDWSYCNLRNPFHLKTIHCHYGRYLISGCKYLL